MAFIMGLSRTVKQHDSMWVIVDRLTKSAHFLAIKITYTSEKLAEIYIQEIVRLLGAPLSIVSDCDSKLMSKFWRGFQVAMGTKLNVSTSFHSQTNRQTERTIQTMEDMLRAYALDIKEG